MTSIRLVTAMRPRYGRPRRGAAGPDLAPQTRTSCPQSSLRRAALTLSNSQVLHRAKLSRHQPGTCVSLRHHGCGLRRRCRYFRPDLLRRDPEGARRHNIEDSGHRGSLQEGGASGRQPLLRGSRRLWSQAEQSPGQETSGNEFRLVNMGTSPLERNL